MRLRHFWAAPLLLELGLLLAGARAQTCGDTYAQHGGLRKDSHFDYGKTFTTLPVYTRMRDLLNNKTLELDTPPCPIFQSTPAGFPGAFFVEKDRHIVYEPAACRLRRLDAAGARKCLAGKRIAWVGDSVVRYQYLAMAHFLALGEHIPRYHLSTVPSIVNENEWEDKVTTDPWEYFYNETQAILTVSGGEAGGQTCETCDCRRRSGPGPATKKFKRSRKGKQGKMAEIIDFSQVKESRRFSFCPAGDPSVCDAGCGSAPDALHMAYEQAFRHPSVDEAIVQKMDVLLTGEAPPDVLIMNAGLWYQGNTSSNATLRAGYRRMFQHGRRVMQERHLSTRLLFKPTTRLRSEKVMDVEVLNEIAISEAVDAGWEMYDLASLNRVAKKQGALPSLMWDQNHYYAIFYEQANDLLLNMLCDSECAWAAAAPAAAAPPAAGPAAPAASAAAPPAAVTEPQSEAAPTPAAETAAAAQR